MMSSISVFKHVRPLWTKSIGPCAICADPPFIIWSAETRLFSNFHPGQRKKKQFRKLAEAQESPLPEAPELSQADVQFVQELEKQGWPDENTEPVDLPLPAPPPPPEFDSDLEPGFERELSEVNGGQDSPSVKGGSPFPKVPKYFKITPLSIPAVQRTYQKSFLFQSFSLLNLMTFSRGFCSASISKALTEKTVSIPEATAPVNLSEGDIVVESFIKEVEKTLIPGRTRKPMKLKELANRSVKIQELVKLGIDLSVIVKRHGQMERLLHQNLEEHIKPRIRLLVDFGVEPDRLGWLLTKNPALLWTSMDDMVVRVNYLEAKLFTPDMIRTILNNAPLWLSLTTKEIDSRLGYFQQSFHLSGDEVRQLTVKAPTVVSTHLWPTVLKTTKLMDLQFNFSQEQRKDLLLKEPKCYIKPLLVESAFNYFYNEAGFNQSVLVRHPYLLITRLIITKPRHQFLQFLKRDQFDVDKPGYISPDCLWEGTIEDFCVNVAKCTVEEYETFLQNL